MPDDPLARSAALHAQLVAFLPERDHALIGWPAILGFLDHLQVTRPNGRPVRVHMLRRWRHSLLFPLLNGYRSPYAVTPPASTTFAITAWLLSRRSSGDGLLHLGYRSRLAIRGENASELPCPTCGHVRTPNQPERPAASAA